jgi:hypothetical protein
MKWISAKFLCIFCLLASSFAAFSQSQPESSMLLIESQDGAQTREVPVGQRLHYQLKGGEMQKGGRLESVDGSSVSIGGRQIAMDSLETIVVKKGKKRTSGAGLAIRSLVALPILFLLWLLGMRSWRGSSDAGGRVMLVLLTLVTFLVLPLFILIGLLMMATASKRYDLRKGWKLRSK